MGDSWSPRQDGTKAPGCYVRLVETERGLCIRYLLMLRRMPVWRPNIGVSALTVRVYDDGTVTLADDTAWGE